MASFGSKPNDGKMPAFRRYANLIFKYASRLGDCDGLPNDFLNQIKAINRRTSATNERASFELRRRK